MHDSAKANLLIPHGFEANYTIGFARGLVSHSVPITVISSDDLAPRLEAAGIAQRNLRGNQDHRRTAIHKAGGLLLYYARLFRTVFRHRGRTIHFTGLLDRRLILIDALLLQAWFRLCASRYVYTAHNTLPHGREKKLLFRAVYRLAYRFPHAIVAHTRQVALQLERDFGVHPSRIHVISIGLNHEVPAPKIPAREAKRLLGVPPDAPVALFFGKIEPYKGVDLLVDAWTLVRTPAARLIIAGWCPDRAYGDSVRRAIADSPVGKRIEWRDGFVPNEQISVWLQACDVVVLPYRSIYQSGVVFLCLRFGVPVVATNVGSMSEFVTPNVGIVSESNDSSGIAAAIDRFFAEKSDFNRDAIARDATKYRWELQCASITRLYA